MIVNIIILVVINAIKQESVIWPLPCISARSGKRTLPTCDWFGADGSCLELNIRFSGSHLWLCLELNIKVSGSPLWSCLELNHQVSGSPLWPCLELNLQVSNPTLWQSSPSSYSHFYVGSMYDDIRLHVARSYTSSADSPFSLMSSFTLSNHLLLGLPLFLLPCTFITIALLPT